MNPAESIWLGRRLEQFNPFFYEDPMLPDSPATDGGSPSAVQHSDRDGRAFHDDFRVPATARKRRVCVCSDLTFAYAVVSVDARKLQRWPKLNM